MAVAKKTAATKKAGAKKSTAAKKTVVKKVNPELKKAIAAVDRAKKTVEAKQKAFKDAKIVLDGLKLKLAKLKGK